MFCPTSTCQPGCRLFPLALMLLLLRASSLGSGIDSISVETSPTSINISWVISSGSSWDYYTLEVIKSSRSLSGYPTNTTGTTHLITGLDPERLFTITVTPWNAEGAGDSRSENATTEAIPEGVILVSDVTSSSAFLQWRADEGVIFYKIVAEPSDAIGFLGGIFEEEVGLTILHPGTVFNVTVQNGQSFMELASTQIRSAPESPVNISLEKIGTTMATLSWTPPSSSHDAYEFYVINNSTNERLLITTAQRGDVSNNMETLPDLSPATIYLFEVGSVLNPMDFFQLQRSDEDDNPTVYGRTAPESPVNISVKEIGTTMATLSWIPPSSSHDAYEFYVINNSTNERLLITTAQRGDVSDNMETLPDLSPATIYLFEVGSVLNPMDSFRLQRSDEDDNPTIYVRTAPESPVNISLKEIGTTMATLSWIPPSSSHDAYEFYVINNSTNDRLLITTAQRGDVSDNMETLPDLSPATIYSFEVGSVLNPMDSFRLQRSDEDDNPTVYGRTGPEAPLDIVINGITESSIEVTLIPPRSHHDGYEIILSYSTTNQTTYNSTIQMEENVAYNWTSSGLSFSTDYTLVVGTFLNVEGSFPFQRSENNLMKTFKTGSAVALNLHYVLLLITAFLSLLLV